MTLYDFEEEVNGIIVGRGKDYFLNGAVKEIEEVNLDRWVLKIEGKKLYKVEIILEQDEILESSCTCPFDFGPYCKHEVAAFLALKDIIEEKEHPGNIDTRLHSIIDTLDEKTLKKIILDQAHENDLFARELIYQYEIKSTPLTGEDFKALIWASINVYRNFGGINFQNAWKAADGAYIILNDAKETLEDLNVSKAITMVQTVIEEIMPHLDFLSEDDNGVFYSVVNKAFSILALCCQQDLNENLKQPLFLYMLEKAGAEENSYYHDWFTEYISMAADLAEGRELKKVFAALDKGLKQRKNSERFYPQSRINNLLLFKYELIKRKKGASEAEAFFEDHLHLELFREKALKSAVEQEEWDKVISLSLAGEEQDRDEPFLIKKWRQFRMEAYIGKGDIENQKKLGLLFIIDHLNLTYYDFIKEHSSPGEWPALYGDIVEKLIARKTGAQEIIADLYVKEERYHSLLTLVKKHPWLVGQYKEYLMEHFADDVYEIYEITIKNEARAANQRSHYRKVCHSVSSLMEIGGELKARELISAFRTRYKNKSAFMDELNKI